MIGIKGDERPDDKWCWAPSYFNHCAQAKQRSGAMVQIVEGVETISLSDAQVLEAQMAKRLGLPVYRLEYHNLKQLSNWLVSENLISRETMMFNAKQAGIDEQLAQTGTSAMSYVAWNTVYGAAFSACTPAALLGPTTMGSQVADFVGGQAAKRAADALGASEENAARAGNAGGGVSAVGAGAAVGAVLGGPVGALFGSVVGGASCAFGKGLEYSLDAVKSHYREGEYFTVNIEMDEPKTTFHGGEQHSGSAQLYEMGLVSLELTSPWPAQELRGYKGDVIAHTHKKIVVEFFDATKNEEQEIQYNSHGSVHWQLPGRHSMSYGGTAIARLKITPLE